MPSANAARDSGYLGSKPLVDPLFSITSFAKDLLLAGENFFVLPDAHGDNLFLLCRIIGVN
jgi:hypothetical protein